MKQDSCLMLLMEGKFNNKMPYVVSKHGTVQLVNIHRQDSWVLSD
jgi:hypothetical protein